MKRFKIIILLCSIILAACSYNTEKALHKSAFYFDTSIQITLYEGSEEILDNCIALCKEMELIFSRTNPNSELYKINHRSENTVSISEHLRIVIEKGLEAHTLSNHKFDIRVAPLLDLYNFSSSAPSLPNSNEIQTYLNALEDGNIILEGNTLTFPNNQTQLDLGALAKGYIADYIQAYLVEEGIESALINLGGNVLCLGKKEGALWKVGIQKPFGENGESIYIAEIEDLSVVSSGIYERCFTQDDIFYHHLLDATSAYPHNNDLWQVSIFTKSSLEADMLSSTLYFLGLEEAIKYIEKREDCEAIFVDHNGTIHYSSGLK